MTAPAAAVAPESHPCRVCTRCRTACGCYGGICERCEDLERAEVAHQRGLVDRARYEAELRDPERLYAIPPSDTGRLHDVRCSVVTGLVVEAEASLDDYDRLDDTGWDWARWPHLLTRTEAAALRRERCRLCAPDLPAKPPPKVRTKRTGLGWPLADGRCAR